MLLEPTTSEWEFDPMRIPAQFRHLFAWECRCCHEEVKWSAWKAKDRAGRICPHCRVALAVEPIPQGKPGAWVGFLNWLAAGEEGAAREHVVAWLDATLAWYEEKSGTEV